MVITRPTPGNNQVLNLRKVFFTDGQTAVVPAGPNPGSPQEYRRPLPQRGKTVSFFLLIICSSGAGSQFEEVFYADCQASIVPAGSNLGNKYVLNLGKFFYTESQVLWSQRDLILVARKNIEGPCPSGAKQYHFFYQ